MYGPIHSDTLPRGLDPTADFEHRSTFAKFGDMSSATLSSANFLSPEAAANPHHAMHHHQSHFGGPDFGSATDNMSDLFSAGHGQSAPGAGANAAAAAAAADAFMDSFITHLDQPQAASSRSSPGLPDPRRYNGVDGRSIPRRSSGTLDGAINRLPATANNSSPDETSLYLNSPVSASPSTRNSPEQPSKISGGPRVPEGTSDSSTLNALNSQDTNGPRFRVPSTTRPERSDSLLSAYSAFNGGEDSPTTPMPAVKPTVLSVKDDNKVGESPQDKDAETAAEKRQSSRFVYKLMRMVADPESQHLISFNPSGTSVVVTNFDDFAKEVLPKHFKHSNFSSFIRQLNMYGFYKVNKTPRGQRSTGDSQIWEFSHPKFIRGRPDLLDEIRRKALDNDHARVEARDLQFNVSFGQYQLRQHLEEMQWRLDQTMEVNHQLREFSLGLHKTLAGVLDYVKASNGGQMPFDAHLPHPDMIPSPMMPSPFGVAGPWGSLPAQMGGPPPQQLRHERPSIFVTEPGYGAPTGSDPAMMGGNPPVSPHDAPGPFSMSGLQHVSPFGSRRVSGASSNHDNTPFTPQDGFPPQPGFNGGMPGANVQMHSQTQPNTPMTAMFAPDGRPVGVAPPLPSNQQQQQQHHNHHRPDGAIANLPRRSMTGVMGRPGGNGLAINTGVHRVDGPLSADAIISATSAFSMGNEFNPGLGVTGGHLQRDPNTMAGGPGQQHVMHQGGGLFAAAVSTPLPPSPAVSGYPGGPPSHGGSYGFPMQSDPSRFPSQQQQQNQNPDLTSGNVSPRLLGASVGGSGNFDPSSMTMSNSMISGMGSGQGAGADAFMPSTMEGDDSGDTSLQPNAKAMRTPMKRTASSSGAAVAEARDAVINQHMANGPNGAAKRKSPIT